MYLYFGPETFWIDTVYSVLFAFAFIWSLTVLGQSPFAVSKRITSFVLMLTWLVGHWLFQWFSVLDPQVLVEQYYLAMIYLYGGSAISIFTIHRLVGKALSPILFFAQFSLLLICVFNYLIHLDIVVFSRTTPNWFWSMYTLGINTLTCVILAALFVSDDWFYRKLEAGSTAESDR